MEADVKDVVLNAFMAEPLFAYTGKDSDYRPRYKEEYGDLETVVKSSSVSKSDAACLESVMLLGIASSDGVCPMNRYIGRKMGEAYTLPPDNTGAVFSSLERLRKAGLLCQYTIKNAQSQVFNFFSMMDAGYRYLSWNGGDVKRIERTNRDLFSAVFNPAEICRNAACGFVSGKLVNKIGELLVDATALELVRPQKTDPGRVMTLHNKIQYKDKVDGRYRMLFIEPMYLNKFDEAFGRADLQINRMFYRLSDMNWYTKFVRRDTYRNADGVEDSRYKHVGLVIVVDSKRSMDKVVAEIVKRDVELLEYVWFTTCNHVSIPRLMETNNFLFKTMNIKKEDDGSIKYGIAPVGVEEMGL